MKTLKRLLVDESGISAVEYALLLALVGAGVAAAAWYLGTTVSNKVNEAANAINTTGS